jgi:signal transduction histidine kinase
MRLHTRLLLAQLPALAVVLVLLVWGGQTVARLGAQSQRILADNYRSVVAAERMKEAVERLDSAAMFRMLGHAEDADRMVAEHRPMFEAELQVEEGNITELGEAEIAASLRTAWGGYAAAYDAFLAAEPEERNALYFGTLLPGFQEVKLGADRVLTLNQDAMARRSDEAAAAAARAQRAYLGWSLAGVVAAIALSAWVAHRLTVPLRAVGLAATEVGEGNLDLRLPRTRVPEIDQLAAAFNAMADRLRLYRRANDSELARARETAQAAIESLVDPVLVLTVRGEIRRTNDAARRLLGVDERAKRLDGCDPALVEAIQAAHAAVTEGGKPVLPVDFAGVVVLEAADGEHALLPRATPVYDSVTGELVGVTVLLQDVTRLRRLDELKGNLVNTVAHELRTPLTSLGMALHLALDERVSGPVGGKLAELLATGQEDVQRLRALVEDLLDLSRIQEGKLLLRIERVPAAQLLTEVREAVRVPAEQAELDVQLDVPPQMEPVAADPARLRLALTNLASNAVRFAPRGSTVGLRARSTDGGVRFEVQDAGPGVPPADRERIFERFARSDRQHVGGAGLGLYIASEVVRAHGGRIGVEEPTGGGARFWLEIPSRSREAGPMPGDVHV